MRRRKKWKKSLAVRHILCLSREYCSKRSFCCSIPIPIPLSRSLFPCAFPIHVYPARCSLIPMKQDATQGGISLYCEAKQSKTESLSSNHARVYACKNEASQTLNVCTEQQRSLKTSRTASMSRLAHTQKHMRNKTKKSLRYCIIRYACYVGCG